MKNILQLYQSSNRIVENSIGCYQYDSEGQEYIDFESGVWCASLGHSHPRIVKTIAEQSRRSIHHGYRFRNIYAETLSEKLQRLIGFEQGACAFLSSGSEAVTLAITLSQRLTQRQKILKVDNSYLSAYGIGMIDSENKNVISVEFNDIMAIKMIDFSDISAFIMETGGASVDVVRFPNFDFIREIVSRAKQSNCLIVANEVTTGMGRLGKWFGYQHYKILPDIVVMGKGLGNGYPISAVVVNSFVLKKFNQAPFRYAQSHQNDPIGCAVGLEVLKVIEEERLIDNCNSIGNYFGSELTKLKNKHSRLIKDVRSKGLMLAIEFQPTVKGEQISNRLFESGYLIGFKSNTLRFLPPLVITKLEIDKLLFDLELFLNTQ